MWFEETVISTEILMSEETHVFEETLKQHWIFKKKSMNFVLDILKNSN